MKNLTVICLAAMITAMAGLSANAVLPPAADVKFVDFSVHTLNAPRIGDRYIGDPFESIPGEVKPQLEKIVTDYGPNNGTHVIVLRPSPRIFPMMAVIWADRNKQVAFISGVHSGKQVALPAVYLRPYQIGETRDPVQVYLRHLDQIVRTSSLAGSSTVDLYRALFDHANTAAPLEEPRGGRDVDTEARQSGSQSGPGPVRAGAPSSTADAGGPVRSFERIAFDVDSVYAGDRDAIREFVDRAFGKIKTTPNTRAKAQLAEFIRSYSRNWSDSDVVVLQPQPAYVLHERKKVAHPLVAVVTFGWGTYVGVLNENHDKANWFNANQVSGFDLALCQIARRELPGSEEMTRLYQTLLHNAEELYKRQAEEMARYMQHSHTGI